MRERVYAPISLGCQIDHWDVGRASTRWNPPQITMGVVRCLCVNGVAPPQEGKEEKRVQEFYALLKIDLCPSLTKNSW